MAQLVYSPGSSGSHGSTLGILGRGKGMGPGIRGTLGDRPGAGGGADNNSAGFDGSLKADMRLNHFNHSNHFHHSEGPTTRWDGQAPLLDPPLKTPSDGRKGGGGEGESPHEGQGNAPIGLRGRGRSLDGGMSTPGAGGLTPSQALANPKGGRLRGLRRSRLARSVSLEDEEDVRLRGRKDEHPGHTPSLSLDDSCTTWQGYDHPKAEIPTPSSSIWRDGRDGDKGGGGEEW
ncbi:unnamed protein product, partial [Discosporangium mesarthrocarpum]